MTVHWRWLTLLAVACGAPAEPPSPSEVDDARARIEAALASADQARAGLELLGILPTYECGVPRRTFLGQALEQAHAKLGCVTAELQADGTSADVVLLTYSPECRIGGRAVSGHTTVRFAGGEDRMEVEADFGQTALDGKSMVAKAGYGTCADERRYWGAAEGQLPSRADVWAKIDGQVAAREGLPILGGTTLIFDGPGEVRHPRGTDRVTFISLVYELGEYLPKEGALRVETSSGHRVQTTFHSELWRLGQAEVAIDDRAPINVPIVH